VFTTDRSDRESVSRLLEEAISGEFGFEIPVILRDGAEMGAIVASCPYQAEAEADPTKVHVTFVEPMPSAETLLALDPSRYQPETQSQGPGVIYMHLPEGMGRAKLPVAMAKLTSGVVATTRNWRTVVNLVAMLES
jgi:uncharacterized protein (DUF1697 family)